MLVSSKAQSPVGFFPVNFNGGLEGKTDYKSVADPGI